MAECSTTIELAGTCANAAAPPEAWRYFFYEQFNDGTCSHIRWKFGVAQNKRRSPRLWRRLRSKESDYQGKAFKLRLLHLQPRSREALCRGSVYISRYSTVSA